MEENFQNKNDKRENFVNLKSLLRSISVLYHLFQKNIEFICPKICNNLSEHIRLSFEKIFSQKQA